MTVISYTLTALLIVFMMKSFIKKISQIGYIESLKLPSIMILVFGYFIADFLPGLLIEEDEVLLKKK